MKSTAQRRWWVVVLALVGCDTRPPRAPEVVADGSALQMAEIGVGVRHSCARGVDGTVWCWGGDEHEPAFTDMRGWPRTTPGRVAGLERATRLAVGGVHTCGWRDDGRLVCEGAGEVVHRDDGEYVQTRSLVGNTYGGVEGIALLRDSRCMLAADTRVYCFGRNDFEQLGTGTGSERVLATPTLVPGLVGVVQIACSELHSCALLRDGTVRCWGENKGGQLGNGEQGPRGTPVVVAGLRKVVQIAVGFRRSCAVLRDGELRCWGHFAAGSVPPGSDVPVPVPVLTGVAQVGLGQDHGCARMQDGTVQCWGSRRYGVLGDGLPVPPVLPQVGWHAGLGGAAPSRPTPLPVHGLRDVIGLAVGDYHNCALTRAGRVACWGHNGDGQVGDGTTVDASLPSEPAWPRG